MLTAIPLVTESSRMANPLEVLPAEVKKWIDAGEKIEFIDVREPFEHATARIESAELIPMKTVPQRLQYLESKADDSKLVIFCHHGMRSLMVVNWLREQGLAACVSMTGGIDRWSAEVDSKVPRY